MLGAEGADLRRIPVSSEGSQVGEREGTRQARPTRVVGVLMVPGFEEQGHFSLGKHSG